MMRIASSPSRALTLVARNTCLRREGMQLADPGFALPVAVAHTPYRCM